MHDLVIRNGKVVDGSGEESFMGDIAIDGDRITKVGLVEDQGKEEIDAKGHLVTPGWVDIHTHYDGQVCWDSYLTPSCWHGVTTVVMGNCGVGFAPVKPGTEEFLVQLMEGVEDIPGTALHEGVTWDWESFPEYLDSIGKKNYAIDVGAMIGHGPIRSYVMGYDRCQGKEEATDIEIEKMAEITKEAIEAGALGFSTSRTYLHRDKFGEYVPGTEASAKEMRKIANAIADLGKGTLEIVSDWMDKDIELDWVKEFVEESDRTLTYAQTSGDPFETWKYCEENFSKGVKIRPQYSGRPTGMLFSLESTVHPFIAHPSYAEIADKSLEEKVSKMRDESFKQKILSEEPAVDKNHMIYTLMTSFDKQFPMDHVPNYEPPIEASIVGIAESSDKPVMEVLYEELLKNDGKTFIWAPFGPYPNHNLDFYKMIIEFESSVAGLSDGGAHCGLICDASMPTWNVSHWSKDRKKGEKIPLEFVVRKQTKETAETFGLMDRGQIKEGYMADINVIDYDNLCVFKPEMVHDLPTGSRRIIQKAQGYKATIKSGVVTFKDDEATGAMPGSLIRGEQSLQASA
jgi:N-acyl-D-aspartate/D-glutamate deacylase